MFYSRPNHLNHNPAVLVAVVVIEQYPVWEVDISIVLQQQVWDLNEAFFSSQRQRCKTVLTQHATTRQPTPR